MASHQIETEAQCPWCFEEIALLVDPSVEEQTYIEDCSVCCRPIQIHATCENEELISILAERS